MLSAMTSPIRLRAIRAAQVASLSATLASSTACVTSIVYPDASARDAFTAADAPGTADAFQPLDAYMAVADTGSVADTGAVADIGAVADTGAVADAGPAADAGCTAFPPATQACCLLEGGFWDEASMFCAIAVPGPFVPPSMNV